MLYPAELRGRRGIFLLLETASVQIIDAAFGDLSTPSQWAVSGGTIGSGSGAIGTPSSASDRASAIVARP